MKVQIDSTLKTIKLEESINLKELIEYLPKLFCKGNPFGKMDEYKLETNTTILNWEQPYNINPYWSRPWYSYGSLTTYNAGTGVADIRYRTTTNSSIFNASNNITLSNAVNLGDTTDYLGNHIYNIEFNTKELEPTI